MLIMLTRSIFSFYSGENGEVCAATSSTSIFRASPRTPAKLVKLTSEIYTVTAELGDSSESQQRLLVRRGKKAKGRGKSVVKLKVVKRMRTKDVAMIHDFLSFSRRCIQL